MQVIYTPNLNTMDKKYTCSTLVIKVRTAILSSCAISGLNTMDKKYTCSTLVIKVRTAYFIQLCHIRVKYSKKTKLRNKPKFLYYTFKVML